MAIFRWRCQVTRLGRGWVCHSLCDKTKGEISHVLHPKIERVAVMELRSTYVVILVDQQKGVKLDF